MTSNQIAYWVNEEKKRSNLAQEAENLRHNLEQEKIGRSQAAASMLGAQASMRNASVNAGNLAELKRHNAAMEYTSQYGAETTRYSSVVSALLGSSELGIKQQDANTRQKQYELEASYAPYKKVESATKSVGNLIGATGSIAEMLLLGGN